ncbi:hypothetical protein ES703_123612 [subsurface metagenome]
MSNSFEMIFVSFLVKNLYANIGNFAKSPIDLISLRLRNFLSKYFKNGAIDSLYTLLIIYNHFSNIFLMLFNFYTSFKT